MERPVYPCMVVVYEGHTVVSNSLCQAFFLTVKCLDTLSTSQFKHKAVLLLNQNVFVFPDEFQHFICSYTVGQRDFLFQWCSGQFSSTFYFHFVCGPCWEETQSNQVPSLHEENLPKSRLRYTKRSYQWLNTAFIIVSGALFHYEKKYFLIAPYCYHDYLLSSQHSNQVLNETAFDY